MLPYYLNCNRCQRSTENMNILHTIHICYKLLNLMDARHHNKPCRQLYIPSVQISPTPTQEKTFKQAHHICKQPHHILTALLKCTSSAPPPNLSETPSRAHN